MTNKAIYIAGFVGRSRVFNDAITPAQKDSSGKDNCEGSQLLEIFLFLKGVRKNTRLSLRVLKMYFCILPIDSSHGSLLNISLRSESIV